MTGLRETEKRALALADNKVAQNAGWDRAILATELADLAVLLPEIDLSLDITGFEAAEIDGLAGDLTDRWYRPGRTPKRRTLDMLADA